MEKYRKTNLFTLELGIDLCSEEWIYELIKSIQSLRKEFFDLYGFVIPKVHVIDDIKLKPLEYVIKVNGYDAGRFEFQSDSNITENYYESFERKNQRQSFFSNYKPICWRVVG